MSLPKIPKRQSDWFSGTFLVAAAMMVAAILFVRPATAWLARYYAKQSAPIRCPLRQFDFSALPSFHEGWKVSMEELPTDDIGTREYIAAGLIPDTPAAVQPALFVTYYNDPRDKVPHTPDVCWRQAGYVVKQMSTVLIPNPQLGSGQPTVNAILLVMDGEKVDLVNLHLFLAEGHLASSRNQVRWQIAKPGNTHTYFSKVEVAVKIAKGRDPSDAIEACKLLMSEALPVLLGNHFPAAEQLRQRN